MNPPGEPPPSRRGPLAVLAVVAAACAGWLLVTRTVDGYHVTRALVAAPELAAADHLADVFACVDEEVEEKVPSGATIHIDVEDPLWYQRLAGSAVASGHDLRPAATADVIVRVAPPANANATAPPPPPACGGVLVVVTPGTSAP
jgi:hypothetical protein